MVTMNIVILIFSLNVLMLLDRHIVQLGILKEFLKRVESVPWDSRAARHYGELRSRLEKCGNVLSPMDTLIAAHALSLRLTLISGDKALHSIEGLSVEDWAKKSAV